MLVVMFFLVVFIFLWYMWLVGFYMYLCVDKIFFFIVVIFFFFVIILCVIFEDLLYYILKNVGVIDR